MTLLCYRAGHTVNSNHEVLGSCRRNEDTENTPIVLDLKYKGCKEENLAQIRTNPPSPQCFSAKRGVTSAALTPTAFKPRTQVPYTAFIQSWKI